MTTTPPTSSSLPVIKNRIYPLITIITVTFNCRSVLEKTLKSVLSQTYPNIEYIIIDGASTDGTLDLIKQYELKVKNKEFPNFNIDNFRWVSEPDRGLIFAMNKGARMANGEFINILSADDYLWSDTTLADIFCTPYSSEYVNVIYGDAMFRTKYGDVLFNASPVEKIYERFLKLEMPTSHQSIFIRTKIFHRFPLNTKYRIAADFEQCYQLFKDNKDQFLRVNVCVCSYNATSGNSLKHWAIGMREDYSILGRYNTFIDIAITEFRIGRQWLKIHLTALLPSSFVAYCVMKNIKRSNIVRSGKSPHNR